MSDQRRNPKSSGGGGQGQSGRGNRGGSGKRGAGGGAKGQGAKGQGGKGQGGKGGGRRPRAGEDDPVGQLAGPLRKVLDRLPETQRRVLELRMGLVDGHPKNLTETAETLGMTMHEAKQVEQRAFEHIREAVPLDQLQKLLKH